MKNNCKRLIKRNLRLEMWLKEKETDYMSNGKVAIIHLIVGMTKKI